MTVKKVLDKTEGEKAQEGAEAPKRKRAQQRLDGAVIQMQCKVPKETDELVETAAKKNFRTKSLQVTFYLIKGLKEDGFLQ